MSDKEIIGKRFGKIFVLEKDINREYYYLCRCDCGCKKSILLYNLKNGRTKSCGCVPNKIIKKDKKFNNLYTQKFNFLTAVEYIENMKKWKCLCNCGKYTFVNSYNLQNGQVKSCGCYNPRKKQLKGLRFGKLVVLERASNLKDKTRWSCVCDCGNFTIVSTSNLSKKIKGTKSCGCLINVKNCLPSGEAAFNKVYRMYKYSARTRKIDFNLTKKDMKKIMQGRCYYCNIIPSNTSFGKTYHGNYVYNGIDRIDSNIGYELDNCVSCCSMCNIMKRKFNIDDFLEKIKKIHDKHFVNSLVRSF